MMACTTNGNVERNKYNIMPGLIVRPCQRLPRMVLVLGRTYIITRNRVPAELMTGTRRSTKKPTCSTASQTIWGPRKACTCFARPLLQDDTPHER